MPAPRRKAVTWRSGLEQRIQEDLTARGVPYRYEEVRLAYVKPQTNHKYTPDFILPNGIVVESKGKFEADDRQKHVLLKQQHPELDIRFLFTRSASPLRKGAKSTYADWCLKEGFQFADAPSAAKKNEGLPLVPQAWIDEPAEPARIAAIEAAQT